MYNRPLKNITYKFPFLNGHAFSPLEGVYLILKNDRVMYVGQSRHTVARVTRHFGGAKTGEGGSGGPRIDGKKRLSQALEENFDKVLFVEEQHPYWRDVLEAFYIWKFDPPLCARKPRGILCTSDRQAWQIISRMTKLSQRWRNVSTRRSF